VGNSAEKSNNSPRANQLALHMERLGIHDNENGHQILTDHFKSVAQQNDNVVNTWTNEFGSFETRESVFIGPSGKAVKFEVGYEVEENGTRKFTTAVPKADWKKSGSGGRDNLRSDGEPPEWWPNKVVNEK
jgi:filamentous hemagglutinin